MQINVNDANLYYEENGSGKETIFFSHGLLWSCRMYDKQIEFLKNHYRTIAYDHRGQGKSEITKNGYDMDTLSIDAANIIEKLNIAPVHFVGLSMGGFVGMRLAARRPELIKSLILMETSADPEPEENIPKYNRLAFVGRWLGFRFAVKPVMRIMFSTDFLQDPDRRIEQKYWEQQFKQNNKIGTIHALKGVTDRKGIYDEIEKIKKPTLIMVGEQDIATVPAKAERMHSKITGSKLVYIPKAGHTSSVEQSDFVNKTIYEFLNSQK